MYERVSTRNVNRKELTFLHGLEHRPCRVTVGWIAHQLKVAVLTDTPRGTGPASRLFDVVQVVFATEDEADDMHGYSDDQSQGILQASSGLWADSAGPDLT